VLQKDLKLLWGRAGKRCANCRLELSQDSQAIGSAYTLGEQAHIIGEKPGAARWRAGLSDAEMDGYHNRILLCPTHHTEIDKNEIDWPPDKLYRLKSTHELWVRETLADSADVKSLAKQVATTAIIDSAVELCSLDTWQQWTSSALAADACWEKSRPGKLFKFRQRVYAAIWPEGYEELERATTTLSILAHRASEKFLEHARLSEDVYVVDRFYQTGTFNPQYDRDLKRFNVWQVECARSIHEASKAANWFADVVRRDINPMFFAERGKFLITEGPFFDLRNYVRKLEYTAEEKTGLPESLFDKDD
jgi:hypothetical protein